MIRLHLSAKQELLLVAGAILHVGIGLRELFHEEADFGHKASAWQLLFRVLPEPAWNSAWLVCGLLMLAGWWRLWAARAGFFGSAALFVLWSAGSFWSFVIGAGATLYGSAALGYVALLQLIIASMTLTLDDALLRAEALHARLEQATDRLHALERRLRSGPPDG